jgi:2-polyprenyl-3-methyl-5-hydroxy-6-metoxy-1,4-benzoquinol methylase
MADADYVREYFSDYASQWLGSAYSVEEFPQKYPTGLNRVRLALQSIAERLGGTDGDLLDLGCGGGELCVEAAKLGMRASGVDIAQGMIEQAQELRAGLGEELQGKLDFSQGDVLDTGLPGENYDAVVALGLIEYLDEDQRLFDEAARLLRPGGVFILSGRNRLFNMGSLNAFTLDEVESGSAASLLGAIIELPEEALGPEMMASFLERLKAALPRLEKALELDREQGGAKRYKPKFTGQRRQHSPANLWKAAQAAGMEEPVYYGVHPHPFPPKVKLATPRFFAELARVYECFEAQPVSLLWSSAFIASFRKAA